MVWDLLVDCEINLEGCNFVRREREGFMDLVRGSVILLICYIYKYIMDCVVKCIFYCGL